MDVDSLLRGDGRRGEAVVDGHVRQGRPPHQLVHARCGRAAPVHGAGLLQGRLVDVLLLDSLAAVAVALVVRLGRLLVRLICSRVSLGSCL